MVVTGNGEFVVAGLLDIPFIFDLILEGSFSGSFTDAFLKRKGYFQILILLLPSLHWLSWLIKTRKRELLLFVKQEIPIGFIQIESTVASDGMPHRYIMTCAIVPKFRGHRYGREMISLLISQSLPGSEICGRCTKYARAMQRTFKNLHFVRTSVGHGLDNYAYVIPHQNDASITKQSVPAMH